MNCRTALLLSCLLLSAACNFNGKKPGIKHNSTGAKFGGDTIYIQPFYPFDNERAQRVAIEVQKFYHVHVLILQERKIYDEAKSPTGRYSAAKLLDLLDGQLNGRKGKMLGLTSYDIFCEKNGVKEWGIFGLGNCPGSSCVVSDFRLKKFKDKTEEFTINTTLHELGHTFGLPHCDYDERCLMNDAKGTIKTLYREKRWLCPHCAAKIGLAPVPI